jgi:hypothetical protein
MAEDFNTLEKDYNNAKAEFDRWSVDVNADGTYTVEGKTYKAAEFGKLRNKAKSAFQKIEKKYKQARSDRSRATQQSKDESVRLRAELNATERENKGIAAALADGKSNFNGRPISQATIDQNNQRIATIKETLSPGSTVANQPVGDQVQGPVAGRQTTSSAFVDPNLQGPMAGRQTTSSSFDPNKPKTEVKPKAPRTGGGPPTTPGMAPGDTKAKGGVNYTWNGTRWVSSGKGSFEKTEATFRKMFPSQAWLLDLDRTKYPKLFELIQRGVDGRMFETPQGLERFAAELKNTDFYTELATTDKVRQIKAVTGDLGFEGSNFNKFLTTSMNMGWEGETLKAETYKEVFRKDDAGNYINQTAVQRAKKSNEYLKVANVGKAFFNTISDSTIESRLTGGLNDDDIQRQQRELAKTKYAHLGNLIDQGFTLADLSSGFKQQAASLLEKDENAIDMSQADFEAAYNYGEPGQKRMMTNGEWEIMLRSNAKFGWDKTNNAKAEARQLASSISQAFGRVI